MPMSNEPSFPRYERNADGEPIANIGPHGGLATIIAFNQSFLPKTWPDDWPEDGMISMDDPRVTRYFNPETRP